MAVTGNWIGTLPGSWTDPAKWAAGTIPNAPGDTANFTNNILGTFAISLDGGKTVGTLRMGDSISSFGIFQINSGNSAPLPAFQLVFDQNGVADANLTIPLAAGVAANTISTGILLKDQLVITAESPDKSTTQLSISGSIVDEGGSGCGIIKNGPGIVQLSAPNNYHGGTWVNGGRLTVSNPSALASSAVTVANGAQLFLSNVSAGNNIGIAGNGYTNSADAASQAGALRIGASSVVLGDIAVSISGARAGVTGTDAGFLSGNLSGSGALEINGPSTTTGGLTLMGSGGAYTGPITLARGGFDFRQSLGGSLVVSPGSGATVELAAGTGVAGDLTLDSALAMATVRIPRGILAIGGQLNLAGTTAVVPSIFPAPGTSTQVLMTYSAKTGAGGLSFDNTGYRGSPVISANATEAAITGLEGQLRTWTNASGNSNWSVGASTNWAEGDQLFYHADAVEFGDAGSGTVNLVGTVSPQSVVFNNTGTNHYTLAGSGAIGGAGAGIVKNGDAWLTLGGANTFTGPILVNAGRLLAGSASGFGRTSGVHVAPGAVLDLYGKTQATTDIWIAGSGDGLVPAITNGSTTLGVVGNVTLAADATFGGPSGSDFALGSNGVVDGSGFTFTKVGGNKVLFPGRAKSLRTVVKSGGLSGSGPDPFGSSLRIEGGATVDNQSGGGIYTSDVEFESTGAGNGFLVHRGNTDSLWTGTFTSNGSIWLQNPAPNGTTMTLAGDINVLGGLVMGPGPICLTGTANVGDHVSVTGRFILGDGGSNGAIDPPVPIVMSGSSPSLAVNRSGSFTLSSVIGTISGSLTQAGTGTLTLTANNRIGGGIVVGRGALLINGNHTDAGTTAVVSGALLGGSGTLPGAVTINVGGTISPGVSIGTFTTGAPGLVTAINGTLRIEHDGSAPNFVDLLKCNGPLNLGLNSTVDFNALGSPPGGAVQAIATATARSGTFSTVSDLPPGYALAYSSTAVYLIDIGYQTWISSKFPGVADLAVIGPDADPDHDQLENRIENYLGTDPSAPNAGLQSVTATHGSLSFLHSRADAPAACFTVKYEWSPDLVSWYDSGAGPGGVTASVVPSVILDRPSPANDEIQVQVTVSGGAVPKVFVRLKTT